MALDEEIEKLKHLSPRERIRKLKKIEEGRKKEIAEAEELMRESERELTNEEEIRRKVPIPQVRATDKSALIGESESARRIWKTAHFREGEEETSAITGATSPATEGMSELERAAQEAPSEKKGEEGPIYHAGQKAEKQKELYGRQEQAEQKELYKREQKAPGEEHPGSLAEELGSGKEKYMNRQSREQRQSSY